MKRAIELWVNTLACCGFALIIPSAGEAQQKAVCEEIVSAQIDVDRGNPWRPPFGLERVGAPAIVHVRLTANHRPHGEYNLIAYQDGKEIVRRTLDLVRNPATNPLLDIPSVKGRFTYFANVRLPSDPDTVTLVARCLGDTLTELQRVPVTWPDLDAAVVARPDRQINPVDLGAILVPNDWLLLAGGQKAEIGIAAIAHRRDVPNARVRAWFGDEQPVELTLPLALDRRATRTVEVPLSSTSEQNVLHVTLEDGDRQLWKKDIATMVVPNAPKWPQFGAVETKLRYDAPISVKNAQTGTLSSMDYNTAWDPKLKDVVVFLPNGSRYVFWRGSSYIPFWAGLYNTGFCYEWTETVQHESDGALADAEPLADRELRYGRVRILESSASRVHVRWTYQATSPRYTVWGDETTEDYYFYPDGFGTRVITLTSPPGSDYELSEFVILTPREAFPLDNLPSDMVELVFPDGQLNTLRFPARGEKGDRVYRIAGRDYHNIFAGRVSNPRRTPIMYRVFDEKRDAAASIYFNPGDASAPFVQWPIYEHGELVAPAYWGSHWPLNRGDIDNTFGPDELIHYGPAHSSVMTWGIWSFGNRPTPISTSSFPMPDSLGRSRVMNVQRWAYLIAKTNASDDILKRWAQSFSAPPTVELTGGTLDFPSYSPERRAIRLIVESPTVDILLRPAAQTMNPVFELDRAPKILDGVAVDGQALPPSAYAWDGATLWISAAIGASGARIRLQFR